MTSDCIIYQKGSSQEKQTTCYDNKGYKCYNIVLGYKLHKGANPRTFLSQSYGALRSKPTIVQNWG